MSLRIGGIEIPTPVVLGPMAGITDLAYRRFYRPFGVGLAVSEMISDCGLAYGNARTIDYLSTAKDDHPLALQLFGSDLETSKKAIAIMEEKGDYEILDLNFGCPVHKVTKTGAGSAWLAHPQELYEYVRGIVSVSHKPVTAKIRLGIDEKSINVFEVSSLLEKAGVKALAVHARTKVQFYAGEADYEAIRDLGKSLSIPLIVSGDIFSPEAALKAMEISGASFVMVARGAVGRPTLIRDINRAINREEPLPEPGLLEQLEYAEKYCHLLEEEAGSKVASLKLRNILPHFFKGFKGYKKIRNDIATGTSSMEDIYLLLSGLRKRLGA